jgi:ABC-type multidrug transport system ATPase subunit
MMAHDGPARLSFRAVDPVDVKVKDLSVNINLSPPLWQTPLAQLWNRLCGKASHHQFKPMLDEVSVYMPRGSLTAIIGGSGSGKTSLLNTMVGRMGSARLRVSGSVSFSGSSRTRCIQSAYVTQQDVLIPSLTVRETLQYSADLRLPPPTTEKERGAIVEQVILELGLKKYADTRIGNNAHRGCSDGEKRRISIGVQVLANPSVLFCDELTTGIKFILL